MNITGELASRISEPMNWTLSGKHLYTLHITLGCYDCDVHVSKRGWNWIARVHFGDAGLVAAWVGEISGPHSIARATAATRALEDMDLLRILELASSPFDTLAPIVQ